MNAAITRLVEQEVLERMQAKTGFTALDISNALKAARYPVRHGEVARIVRDIFASGAMAFYDYDRRLIDVVTEGGAKTARAFLYLHGESREREYTARSQYALPPVAADRARDLADCAVAGAGVLSPPRGLRTSQGRPMRRSRGRRDGALAIPRGMVRQMGWSFGCRLSIRAEPGRLQIGHTVVEAAAESRVWSGERVRLCRRKLLLGLLAGITLRLEIVGDLLTVQAAE